MKAVWFLGLLTVLGVVMYDTTAGTLRGVEKPAVVQLIPVSQSPPPVENNTSAIKLVDYIFLHETRNASLSALATAVVRACS